MDRFSFKPLPPGQSQKVKEKEKLEKMQQARLLDKSLRHQEENIQTDSDPFLDYLDANGRWQKRKKTS